MKPQRIAALFAGLIACVLAACSSAADPVAQTATAQAQLNLQATQVAFNLGRTETAVARRQQATLAAQVAATQTAAVFQQTMAPLPRVTHNADWAPQFQTFDGVQMALVPAGCFEMGNDPNAYDAGSQGVPDGGQQCFDQPFWIDEYEVTNSQFAAFSGVAANDSDWTGDQRPRENITWFEAGDFCIKRRARLPTEAEWEYAARGPDDWVYPWGNDFVADNVVYSGNSGNQTADVGSRKAGASWVGALDMAGNVWEWVSSAYQPYPYDAGDGREYANRTDVLRALQGGSWIFTFTSDVRAASRLSYHPGFWDDDIGVRCARSY